MKRFTVGASSQASKKQRTQEPDAAHLLPGNAYPSEQSLQSVPVLPTQVSSSKPVRNSQREKTSSGAAAKIYREYLKLFLLRELLVAFAKGAPKQYRTHEDKAFFDFLAVFEVGLTKFSAPSFKDIKPSKEELGKTTRDLLDKEYQLIYIFICILRYKDRSPRNGWVKQFIEQFIERIRDITQLNSNTFNALYKKLGEAWVEAKFVEAEKDLKAPKELLRYDANICYDVADKNTLRLNRNREKRFNNFTKGEETFCKYFLKHIGRNASQPASSSFASATGSSERAKVYYVSNITIYRDYLKFFILRELLAALERDKEKAVVAQGTVVFEFIKHLQIALTKFDDPSLQAINVTRKKTAAAAPSFLEQEYQLTYIFSCILRYKDIISQKGRMNTFPHEFISTIKNIKQNKLNNNTFISFCKALGKDRIKYFFSKIQEESLDLEDLLCYEENGCYEVLDKDVLLQNRDAEALFRTRIAPEDTFCQYLLKYGTQEAPEVQTSAQAQVSSNPAQPERENLKVFTTNTTGPSFFNLNPLGTITREIVRRDENREILIPQELPTETGNTEREAYPSSNIMVEGPEFGEDEFSYSEYFSDWLKDNPLIPSENGLELSSLSAKDERMPLESEGKTLYLAPHHPPLPSALVLEEEPFFMPMQNRVPQPHSQSTHPLQPERESSGVLIVDTGLSSFNDNPSDTTTIEVVREPEFRGAESPYNGLSMASGFFDWSEEDPLASPENGFELFPIFTEDEVMPLEGESENSRVFTTNTSLSFFNSNSSGTTTREIAQDSGPVNTF